MKRYETSSGLSKAIQAEENEKRAEEGRRRRAARLTGAHTTMPIKDGAMLTRWLNVAREHDAGRRSGVSWYLLLILGFNTGLRVGDLCALKVRDVRDRERVRIVAEKTDKMTDVKLQQAAQKAISAALKGRDGDEYALVSRQKGRSDGAARPITRQRCYAIIREIAQRAGFEEHVGCHTMRKTFAWNYYQAGGDLSKLQKILDHSSQEATLHYLGLDRKALDEVIDHMRPMV